MHREINTILLYKYGGFWAQGKVEFVIEKIMSEANK